MTIVFRSPLAQIVHLRIVLSNGFHYVFNMNTTRGGIEHSGICIPSDITVDKAGENLHYSYPRAKWRKPTDRTLQMFSRLGNASPEEIVAFARQNGILGATQIKPQFKLWNEDRVCRYGGADWAFIRPPYFDGCEPLGLWRNLATQLRAILRINARLKGHTHDPSPKPSPDEWKIIDLRKAGPIDTLIDEQYLFQYVINQWLRRGNVRPVLGTEEEGYSLEATDWAIQINYDGLVGALAYRLLLTVVGEDRLYICSGCGEPYIRAVRAPRPGQENFCSDCVDIASRRAVERYRQKKRRGEGK